MKTDGRNEDGMNMTDDCEEEGWLQHSGERLQDFLMPGLRHAHTLQQLKEFIEYSPPGEYLNKQKP